MSNQGFPSYLGPKRQSDGDIWLKLGLGILFFPLSIVLGGLVDGFVITKLWGWFVEPTFTSAPSLTIPVAWGLAIMVRYVTTEYAQKAKDFWVGALLSPFIVLLIGWILSSYV